MPFKKKSTVERIGDLTKIINSKDFLLRINSEVISSGISYYIGLALGPLGLPAAAISDFVMSQTTDYIAHRMNINGKLILEAIIDALRGRKADVIYHNVGEFWTGIKEDGLGKGAIIEISGLISPYAPLIPAHPMSRPGYSVEGWENLGELETENTEEYDVRDGIIYGDRVVRLPKSKSNKYYAGLYNHDYGISNVSIPLLVDSKLVNSKKNELSDLWKDKFSMGRFVRLKGCLIEQQNFYSTFVAQVPEKCRNLPSYTLEVLEIMESYAPKGVTHVAISVSWENRKKEEKMLTHYLNIQDLGELKRADELLDIPREKHDILFDYDDLKETGSRKTEILEYNELLRNWLD